MTDRLRGGARFRSINAFLNFSSKFSRHKHILEVDDDNNDDDGGDDAGYDMIILITIMTILFHDHIQTKYLQVNLCATPTFTPASPTTTEVKNPAST